MTTTTSLVSSVVVGDSPPPPTRSATTIIAGRAYHVLNIDGYSTTLKSCARYNHAFRSFQFSAGGHTWHISYFPKGVREDNMDFICLFICLDDDTVDGEDDFMAQVTFSILDRHGNPVPSHTHTTPLCNFSVPSHYSFGFENFVKRDELEQSEYLIDDSFAVAVHLAIIKEMPSVNVPSSDMHLHYGDLLSSKEGTDVEFVVGGETFPAHRLVLAARSPVFKAELFGPMKEGVATNAIHIDDMDTQVFKALLVFIYTDTLAEIGQEEDEVAMAQQLLVAANKYGLSRLKLVCEDVLCNHIDTDTVSSMLVLAEKHHCRGIKEVCLSLLGSSKALSLTMKADNFQYLIESCPTIVEDLISNIVARQLKVKLAERY